MDKAEKEKVVKECQQILQKAAVVLFTDFRGLDVAQMSKLRRELRLAGSYYLVVKNTLIERAAQDIDRSALPNMFVGPTGMVYGFDDLVKPVKVARDFAANNPNLKIKAALISGKVIEGGRALEIANLPPRQVLLAQVLMGMQSPIAGWLNVLQGNVVKLLATLKAIGQKKSA